MKLPVTKCGTHLYHQTPKLLVINSPQPSIQLNTPTRTWNTEIINLHDKKIQIPFDAQGRRVTGLLKKMPWGKGINLAAWCLYHTFLEQSRYTTRRLKTTTVKKSSTVWQMTPCCLMEIHRRQSIRSVRLPTSTRPHGVTSQTVGVRYVPAIEVKRAVKATSR